MQDNHADNEHGGGKGPGVPAWRPAALQLTSVGLGLLLQYWWPLQIPFITNFSSIAGSLFLATGLLIVASSYWEFGKARTTLRPDRGATALLLSGPFAYSRNPLYVAVMLLITGVGILVDSLWILGMLFPLFFLMSQTVISPEEKYLELRFGQQYLDYKKMVRRWL